MELDQPIEEAVPFSFWNDHSQYEFATLPWALSQILQMGLDMILGLWFSAGEPLLQRGAIRRGSAIPSPYLDNCISLGQYQSINFLGGPYIHHSNVLVIPLSYTICALFFALFITILVIFVKM